MNRASNRASPRSAICAGLLLLSVVVASPVSEAAGKPRLPKGVKATRLDDGRYAVTASVSASPPGRDRVARLDARTLLEVAAATLCPEGHDLEIDGSPRISIDGAGRFTTMSRGTVRCRTASSADAMSDPQQTK